MNIVGLLSTYREGALARLAYDSVADVCDAVYVFEGPAGAPLEADVPETALAGMHRGEWATDAAKRSAIVNHVHATWDGRGPTWGVWIDGDEVLMQGEFLRDRLQAVVWQDEHGGGEPTAGWPMRIVEMDGSLAVCRAKCVRVDLIDRYIVSSSGLLFRNGATMAEGNLPQTDREWWGPRAEHIGAGRMVLAPPLPGEPYLVHRSGLRHPLRRGLRMHEQERDELARIGVEV